MQRNMDLVRAILMSIEGSSTGFAGYTSEEIGYHIHIMMEDGLIEGDDVTHSGSKGPQAIARSLTWKGHEFLDAARDWTRWSQAKAIIGKIGSAPTSVWMKVLNDLMLKELGAAS